MFGDLAVMYPFDGYNYFLLVVDGFSSKVFVRPLKNKTSSLVAKALDDIFEEFNSQIYVFETGITKLKIKYSEILVNKEIQTLL